MTSIEVSAFDLFSIGHSNIPADRFVALLRKASVNAVADVRSTPYSRFFPWFSRKPFEQRLAAEGIGYLSYGESLGGRPRDQDLYRDGVADYEAMARSAEFQDGLGRLQNEAGKHRVCLMCAEREPLDCHRCLLLARALSAQGQTVGHILHDGAIEPHTATEQRLMDWAAAEDDLFVTGQTQRLAAAYRRRAHAVAYRIKASGVADPGAKPIAERR
jgi:uncharacterized protein (DUF488 family)